MKTFAFICALLVALLFGSSMASAAKCLGKRAKTISANNKTVFVKRRQAVMFTGNNVNVKAKGDNNICSND